MKCAVITPIGPGHHELAKESEESVKTATRHSLGPFRHVTIIGIDDTSGVLGRSAARNKAVQMADASDIEWLLFLDADDLLLPNAFETVREYIRDYDAVWGVIVERQPKSETTTLRNPQVFMMEDFKELLMFDPFFTLQMGHFIRTKVATENRFDESKHTGEDFDYYLRIWAKHRCIKIPEPLFVNRRGSHSTGLDAADGKDWRKAAERSIKESRDRYGMHFDDKEIADRMKDKLREYLNYLESKKSPHS